MHRTIILILLVSLLTACSGISPTPSSSSQASIQPVHTQSPSAAQTVVRAELSPPPTILFQSNRENGAALYRIQPDGRHRQRITPTTILAYHPTWSPDGQRIVFASAELGTGDLFRIDVDGSHLQRLTHSRENVTFPAWSPDGQSIAFVRRNRLMTGISLIRSDGSGWTDVFTATLTPTIIIGPPTWSPNGRELAFSSNIDGSYQIYALTLDGHTRQLTTQGSSNFDPAWSPSGEEIAFVSNYEDQPKRQATAIYLMRTDGSSIKRLTELGSPNLLPAWSPDGIRLAFLSFRTGQGDIYVINRDGSQETRVTNDDARDYRPVWDPSAK